MRKIFYTKSEQAYEIGKIFNYVRKISKIFSDLDICIPEIEECLISLEKVCENEINLLKDKLS